MEAPNDLTLLILSLPFHMGCISGAQSWGNSISLKMDNLLAQPATDLCILLFFKIIILIIQVYSNSFNCVYFFFEFLLNMFCYFLNVV